MIINNGLDLGRQKSEESPDDWTFGALSQPGLVSIPEAERDIYLPLGETQFSNVSDFMDCATRSPINHLEALFTYHYQHGMKPENKKWMEEKGYVKDGKITFSDRFVAINSGTTRQGNSLKAPIESIRKQGLIPKSLLPKSTSFTFEEYHDKTQITEYMRELGAEFTRRFSISYEQVSSVHFGEVLKDDIIGVAAFSWPFKKDGVYPRTEGIFNHAFLLYKLPKFQAFDNYGEDGNDTDFTKNLAPDYIFYEIGYRVYLSSEQVPIDPELEISYYQQLVILLTKLRDFLLLNPQPAPTPLPIPPVPPNSILNAMCLAIQKHEGWILNPPSRSVRNNNPGNCKFSSVGYLPKYGHVGMDSKGFAIFKDYATGFMYLKNLVLEKARKNPSWNLYDFFRVYAPSSDNNDPKRYAEVVASAMGVNVSTFRINQLTALVGAASLTNNKSFMNIELIKVRLISFGYQAGGLILIAILGSLVSSEFRDVVASNLGGGTLGTLGLLAFDAIVKQIRNMYVLNKTPGDIGAIGSTRQVTLI